MASIPGYDRYWYQYQINHDPQWEDFDDDEDESVYWAQVDYKVDENILNRGNENDNK